MKETAGTTHLKFARDTVLIGITNLLVASSQLVFLAFLTKFLGTREYGLWSVVNVTLFLVVSFAGLGLPYAITRFLPVKEKGEIREEFYSVLLLVAFVQLIVSLFIVVFASAIAKTFFDNATEIVIVTGLIAFVWGLDSVYLSFFRALRRMGSYAVITITRTCAEISLVIYLMLQGYGLLSIVLAVLAVRGVILVALFLWIGLEIGLYLPRFSRIGEYLKFSVPTIPANLSAWVISSSDRYVIGYFLGATAVGIYSAAYLIGSIPILIAEVLGFVLPPTVSKLYDEGKGGEVKTILERSLKYFLMIAIPFFFGVALLSRQVLAIFSTADIAAQGYLITPLISLSALLWGIYAVITNILVLVKKTRILAIAWSLSALLNFVLNLVAVPFIGILGAAITSVIAYAVALGIVTYYSIRELSFGAEWGFVFKCLCASGIMVVFLRLLSPESMMDTMLTIFLGIIIYGVILIVLGGLNKAELRFFVELLRRPF